MSIICLVSEAEESAVVGDGGEMSRLLTEGSFNATFADNVCCLL